MVWEAASTTSLHRRQGVVSDKDRRDEAQGMKRGRKRERELDGGRDRAEREAGKQVQKRKEGRMNETKHNEKRRG